MNKAIKFFENLNPYLKLSLKIILGVSVIFLMIYRTSIFPILNNNSILNHGVTLISLIIVIPTLMSSVISIIDLIFLPFLKREERKKENNESYIDYKFDDIIKLLLDNDIIDIKIKINESIVKIGASSDYSRFYDKFFDKLYYIDDTEY